MRFITLLLFPFLLYALTLKEINSMPTSVAKDFYIWLFLQENITKNEAKEAFKQLKNKKRSTTVQTYLQKVSDKEVLFQTQCQKMSVSQLAKESSRCIDEGFSVYKAKGAAYNDLMQIFSKSKNKTNQKVAKIFSQGYVFNNTIHKPDDFTTIFNGCGNAFRQQIFNHTLSKKIVKNLASNKNFSNSIEYIVLDSKLKTLQKSLLFTFNTDNLNAKAKFYLAINAVKYHDLKVAQTYFKRAYESFYYQFDKDKATFWLYLSTNDKFYLKKLLKSSDINIYTLYAKEILKDKIDNFSIVSDFKTTTTSEYDNSDPIEWYLMLQTIKSSDKAELLELSKELQSDKTMGEYAFVMERYNSYQKHYFPMPLYDELKTKHSNEEIAFMYAVARQESRFVPAAISHSFALGKMQIMPFLVKAIAKEKNEDIALTDMFKPKKAFEYGMYQINYLQKHLHHPLIVAYAYNGGIGFTKRKIIERGLFEESSKFEPWLSMELVPYGESKRYGKKVLANYYIYLKILNEEKPLYKMLQTLKDGSKIARWR